MRTFYNVLGITSEATTDEISKAYRESVMRYHPDTTKEKDLPRAVAKFKECVLAHDVLTDAIRRSRYDGKIASLRSKKSKPKKAKPKKANSPIKTFTPIPPKYDLWGHPLTKAAQQQWIRDAQGNIEDMEKLPQEQTMTNDSWFKDVHKKHEPKPQVHLRRRPKPKPLEETFIDTYARKPVKRKVPLDPYGEEFYDKNGVENFNKQ